MGCSYYTTQYSYITFLFKNIDFIIFLLKKTLSSSELQNENAKLPASRNKIVKTKRNK